MQYSEAEQGRIFVLRLEHGETVHAVIENFARKQAVKAASVIIVGGADKGSTLVVGPENDDERPVVPMAHTLENAHEIAGTGTIFPDEDGRPVLHMHMACGREDRSITGCIRRGVKVWQIMEAVLYEIKAPAGMRRLNPHLGFKLLTLLPDSD